MGSMNKILGAIIAATVAVIVIGSVLAPQITQYTGTNGALADYAGLLGAVVVISIVAVLMIAVRLISGGRD